MKGGTHAPLPEHEEMGDPYDRLEALQQEERAVCAQGSDRGEPVLCYIRRVTMS